MTPNFSFALRYLLCLRGSNVTRVISLSLGLAVGLLLFSYAHYQLTADRCFRDGERVYQLWNVSDKYGMGDKFNGPLAPCLAEEVPQIEAATRIHGPSTDDVVRGDNAFEVHWFVADTSFFDVLGFDVLRGDPKEILLHKEQVMLSESAAAKIFGAKDPLGQQILFKGTDPLTVAGIFRDPPANQHLGKFGMLRSFEYAKENMRTDWSGGDSFATYLKLRPGTHIGEVEAQLPAFYDRHDLTGMMKDWGESYVFHPIADSSRVNSPMVLVSWILMALAALTLFVATMNYVLVSVSTLVSRSRTIAMLKVGGARRRDIFAIFCWETALLTAVSVVVAVFLIWALQGQIREITQTPVTELFALQRIWVPLCVVLAAFILAALIPSQLFTSIPVTLAFRGSAANRRRWKQVLLFVEVTCVTVVATLLVTFGMQFDRLRNGDFGFSHDRLVYTSIKTPIGRISAICNEFASMPEIEAAGATMAVPMWGFSGQPCYSEVTRELLFSCRYLVCNEGFLPVMEMPLAAGRNFTSASGVQEALVNQTYVRLRGWTDEEAVGRGIVDNDSPEAKPYTIVGVARDFRSYVATGAVEPIVIHPYNQYIDWGAKEDQELTYTLALRLREITPETLAAVQRKIEEYPSYNNHTLTIYDERLASELSDVRSYRNIVLIVSVIVLLIALTGLIGYLGDEIRRRGKEVALRKIHGATAAQVVRLLGREVGLLCLPALAAGVALSYWCSAQMLTMFVERIALRWWIFAACALLVAAVVAAVQFLRTWRIASSNPVNTLKTE